MGNKVYINLSLSAPISSNNLKNALVGLDNLEEHFDAANDLSICSHALRGHILRLTNDTLQHLDTDPYSYWGIIPKVTVKQFQNFSAAMTGRKKKIHLTCHSILLLRSVFIIMYEYNITDFSAILEAANIIKATVEEYYDGSNELMRFLLDCHTALINEINSEKPTNAISNTYPRLLEKA